MEREEARAFIDEWTRPAARDSMHAHYIRWRETMENYRMPEQPSFWQRFWLRWV